MAITVCAAAALSTFSSSVFANLSTPAATTTSDSSGATSGRISARLPVGPVANTTAMPLARASASSFFIAGKVAMQRGREVQLGLTKSSTSRAVVFGSSVAGFNSGAAGALMLAHSSTMVGVLA